MGDVTYRGNFSAAQLTAREAAGNYIADTFLAVQTQEPDNKKL